MGNHWDSRPRRLAPAGITHRGALLLSTTLLGSAAVVIVVIKRGLLDLGHDAGAILGWVGLALALSGSLYLIHIWWVDRFQFTIGRLMYTIAIIAGLITYVLSLLPST